MFFVAGSPYQAVYFFGKHRIPGQCASKLLIRIKRGGLCFVRRGEGCLNIEVGSEKVFSNEPTVKLKVVMKVHLISKSFYKCDIKTIFVYDFLIVVSSFAFEKPRMTKW